MALGMQVRLAQVCFVSLTLSVVKGENCHLFIRNLLVTLSVKLHFSPFMDTVEPGSLNDLLMCSRL